MTGFLQFSRSLQELRTTTEILEALDWDEEKLELFLEELNLMLIAAPPSLEKALFWLRSTPWDTFDRGTLPANVYNTLERNFRKWEARMKASLEVSRKTQRPRTVTNNFNDDDGWN